MGENTWFLDMLLTVDKKTDLRCEKLLFHYLVRHLTAKRTLGATKNGSSMVPLCTKKGTLGVENGFWSFGDSNLDTRQSYNEHEIQIQVPILDAGVYVIS